MRNHPVYLLTLLLVLSLFLVVQPSPALACSTTTVPYGIPTPKPDIPENRAETTPIIFEGVVAGYDIIAYRATASVKVYQYLKGIGPGAVYINGFGNNTGDCRETLKVGQHAIFYANGDPFTRLSANHFRAYSATDDPTLINIQRIIGVVGQKPVIVDEKANVSITPIVVVTPQPSPMVATITNSAQNNSGDLSGIVWFGAGLVVGGMVIAGLFLVLGRRRNG